MKFKYEISRRLEIAENSASSAIHEKKSLQKELLFIRSQNKEMQKLTKVSAASCSKQSKKRVASSIHTELLDIIFEEI